MAARMTAADGLPGEASRGKGVADPCGTRLTFRLRNGIRHGEEPAEVSVPNKPKAGEFRAE